MGIWSERYDLANLKKTIESCEYILLYYMMFLLTMARLQIFLINEKRQIIQLTFYITLKKKTLGIIVFMHVNNLKKNKVDDYNNV